jgi:hypothetical protein
VWFGGDVGKVQGTAHEDMAHEDMAHDDMGESATHLCIVQFDKIQLNRDSHYPNADPCKCLYQNRCKDL